MQSTASQQRLRGQEMREKCLTLRRAGATYAKIGRELGISAKNARKHVLKAFGRWGEANAELADEVRALELQRLDEMQVALYAAGLQPEPIIEMVDEKPQQLGVNRERQLKVIDRLLRIMERRAAILGTDAPKKLEQSGPDGGPIPVKQEGAGVDLAKLSVEQLRQYREILVTASPAAVPLKAT